MSASLQIHADDGLSISVRNVSVEGCRPFRMLVLQAGDTRVDVFLPWDYVPHIELPESMRAEVAA
jgi:hypothetical protein